LPPAGFPLAPAERGARNATGRNAGAGPVI